MRDQFRRESDFIGELCTGFCSDQSGYTTARIPEDLDWHYIVNRGEEHHILPILECVLRSGSTDLPTYVRKTLEEAYRETLGRNLACIAWTDRFLSECGAGGIPVILLKGSSHCRGLYHDVGLRPFTDIDVLVPVECVKNAAEIVEGFGMRIEPGHDLDELLRIYNHATYVMADGANALGIALKVELHWGFHQASTPARFNMDAVWSDAVPSGNHLRLSLEDELIFGSHHLCEHLFFNASPALLWICDLALRLRQSGPSIDWAAFRRKNEAYGTAAASAVALRVVDKIAGIQAVDDLRAWATDNTPAGIRSFLDRLTIGDIIEETLVQRKAQRLAVQLALNPGLSPKWSVAIRTLRKRARSVLRRNATL